MIVWLLDVLYYWLLQVSGILDHLDETARQPGTSFALALPLPDATMKTWWDALDHAKAAALTSATLQRAAGAHYTHLPDYHHLYVSFFVDWSMRAWKQQLDQTAPGWYELWESETSK